MVKTDKNASVNIIVAESGVGRESRGSAGKRGGGWLAHWLGVVCLAVLLAGLGARECGGQTAPAAAAGDSGAAMERTPSGGPISLPSEKREKAIELSRIRNTLEIIESLVSLVLIWLFLASRAAAFLECRAIHVSRRRWVQGLVFFAALIVLSSLAGLPFDMIGHHYSRAFGISVEGWGPWFLDLGKALGLSIVIGAPILLLFNWIVKRWPKRYWFGAWLVTVPLMLLSVFGSPFLEPIFDKFEPLAKEHAGLVADLEKLVARTGTKIPPERMFLMKASEKTNGLNAYVSGMGATKRIVVWDTTAGRIPDDEIMFIFGHESGHYVLNHIPKQVSLSVVGLFFVLWTCAGFAGWLARRFGSAWGLQTQDSSAAPLASRTGFVVLIFAVSIAGFVLQPVINTVSRHYEHEADVYGQEAVHGLVADPRKTAVAAFNALGEAWLDDPNPSPFIEFWEYNHPSVKTRANFAAQYDPWKDGGHGEFFEK